MDLYDGGTTGEFLGLMTLVREQISDGDTSNVRAIVSSTLTSSAPFLDTIIIDGPLIGDELEEEAFEALVSSRNIGGLVLGTPSTGEEIPIIDAQALMRMLVRGLPRMTGLDSLVLRGSLMGTVEAHQIFPALEHIETLSFVGLFSWQDYSNGVMAAFERFIRNSTSLDTLRISWRERPHAEMPRLEAFRSLCVAIGESSSLKNLILTDVPVEGSNPLDQAMDSLTNAIVKCESLSKFHVDRNAVLMDQVCNAVSLTRAVSTFDFGYRRKVGGMGITLKLMRPSPWKALLSQTIRLNVWPLVLAETRYWNTEETSHCNPDILFFLLKEKSDVLLQNIHRRRIRKRKRYGF